jgi:predicted XRE-type DNA-binding protein
MQKKSTKIQRPHFDPLRPATVRQMKVKALRAYLEKTGLTQRKFASAVGCSEAQVNRFLNFRGDLYLSTWELFESAMSRAGIDWRDYWK